LPSFFSLSFDLKKTIIYFFDCQRKKKILNKNKHQKSMLTIAIHESFFIELMPLKQILKIKKRAKTIDCDSFENQMVHFQQKKNKKIKK